MLIEIWERLRGYDKWIEAEAVIVSGKKIRREFGLPALRSDSRFSSDLLMWVDREGEKRFGPFVNQDTSPLYQLLEGETVLVRYDPSKPDRFYNRAHFLSWVAMLTKAALALIVCGGFIAWRIWMIVIRHGF